MTLTATAATNGKATDAPATLEGAAANVASRATAFFVDVLAINVLFALGGAVVERILGLLVGHPVSLVDSELLYRAAFVAWGFLYLAYPLAVAGRTFGMSVLGLRALAVDGRDLSPGRAVVRVLVFPLSFLLFGLGFALIVVRRDHRALHDLIAGSSVVYSWHARVGHLRFLSR